MVIFPAEKGKANDKEKTLEERVKELLGGTLPDFVWVDNRPLNYRFWNIYPLFAPKGTLLGDVVLPLGAYAVVLLKGCKIELCGGENGGEDDNGSGQWLVSGKIAFRYTGSRIRMETVRITSDGILKFPFPGKLPGASFGTGIRYTLSSYDERVERTVFKTLCSEAFVLESDTELEVNFFPAATAANRWEFTKKAYAKTVFWTVYRQTVRICLPKGFRFELAVGADENGYEEYYFTPSGNAELEEGGLLMPGLSGTERIELGSRLCFCPGGRAYFEEMEIPAKPDTAYLSFPSAVYYSQPEHMNFYSESENKIYEYAMLPGVLLGDKGLPVFPFGGLKENSREAVKLEEFYLNGLRRSIVEEQMQAGQDALCGDGVSYAITRSGMKTAYNSERLFWVQMVPLEETTLGLAYTALSDRFWFALLSSKLFLPLTNLNGLADVPYSVTERRLRLAKQCGYCDGDKLTSLLDKTFLSADELRAALESNHARWDNSIREACCHFNTNLAGWEFRCSPDCWQDYRTLAVIKMTDGRSMSECMSEGNLWGLRLEEDEVEKAKRYYAQTAARLPNSEFGELTEILENPQWKGAVFLRTGVNLSGLPDELEFLVNGIDEENFYAAYVAFATVGASSVSQASGSALIYYEDLSYLHYEEYWDFGFKVRKLELDIRDNRIYQFQASVELLINCLFGYSTMGKSDGESCSLIFDGSYQEGEGGGYYAFVMRQPVEYILDNCGIQRVRFTSASLHTAGRDARFVLGGCFVSAIQENADILSFDELPFEGIAVEMKMSDSGYEFTTDYAAMQLKPQEGILREQSFGKMFPAKMSRMLVQENREATALGFETLKIKGYEDEETLGENWTGFLWLIETGNLGALAAAANLTLELLIAFCPNPENKFGYPHYYCGIRIPSLVRTDTFALPLQGIMSLGFASIELRKDEDFYFRFRNFSLTILGKRFPEDNQDLYLIADREGNLGWYGAAEG